MGSIRQPEVMCSQLTVLLLPPFEPTVVHSFPLQRPFSRTFPNVAEQVTTRPRYSATRLHDVGSHLTHIATSIGSTRFSSPTVLPDRLTTRRQSRSVACVTSRLHSSRLSTIRPTRAVRRSGREWWHLHDHWLSLWMDWWLG